MYINTSKKSKKSIVSTLFINIYKVYNLSSKDYDYNKIQNKRSLLLIKQAIIMFKKSIIISDFYLYYFF